MNFKNTFFLILGFRYEPISISTDSSESNLGETQTITLYSALVLPTTSIIVGNLLFYKSSYSSIKKTLLVSVLYKLKYNKYI